MNTGAKNKSSGDYTAHLIIFLLAFACRIFFLVWIDEPILFGKYPFFAEKLAAGHDIGERIVDLSPFYIYWMTAWRILFGSAWEAAKWFQAFVGTLICLLVFSLGNRVFRKEAGFLAALIYAAYGNVIILETTLEPTVFVLLFNLLAVYVLQLAGEYSERKSRRNGLLLAGGLLTGLSIVTKPSFLLFLPIGLLWILILPDKRASVQGKISGAVLFCTAAALVILPVTIRNYVKLNDFILVTADAGKVFFHGNAKGATALEWTGLPDEGFNEEGSGEPDYAHVLYRRTASILSGKPLSPSESSRFWMQKALMDITEDPIVYIKREMKKFVFFFTDYELHFIASAYKEYKSILRFPFVRYGIIVSLGLTGMILSLGSFRERFLIYGVILLYLASGMIFIVQSRYRTPAVPYLCLFAGHTVFTLKKQISAGRLKTAGLVAFFACVLFFLSIFSFRTEILKTDRWQTATKIYYQLGARPHFVNRRYEAAINDLNGCIAMAPNFSPAYNLRGKAFAMIGQYEKAETDFKKVIKFSAASPKGYKNLGFLYLLLGKQKEAENWLLKARRLSPRDEKILNVLEKINDDDK